MKKITKLLAIFGLCALFTIPNTSGIEEKTPLKKSAPPPIDFVAGQWYQLNDEYYHYQQPETIVGLISTTYEGDFGLHYSKTNEYISSYKFVFNPSTFVIYHGEGLNHTYYYDYMNENNYKISICFREYTPNTLISYYKYFILRDNDNYDMVFYSFNLDLIATKFQPLIYLGYAIFDNYFVQYESSTHPNNYKTLNFFEGQFVSGGYTFVGMKASYFRANGFDYTTDGITAKQVPLDPAGFGLWICTGVSYIRPDLSEYPALVQSSQYIGDSPYPSSLVFREKKYSSIHIKTYSTEIDIITSNRALNSFESLLMRPEEVDYGFTDNGGNVFTNAFSLIALVYTSLAGFLSFQLFPGLTLGLFILIPLVITIIVLIFKAVK